MVLGKKSLRDIIGDLFTACGNAVTANFLDDIKNMGYRQAMMAGIAYFFSSLLIFSVPSSRGMFSAIDYKYTNN